MEVAEEGEEGEGEGETEKTSLKSLLKQPHKTKVTENKLILSLIKRCFVMLQLISSNKLGKPKSCLSRMEHLQHPLLHTLTVWVGGWKCPSVLQYMLVEEPSLSVCLNLPHQCNG